MTVLSDDLPVISATEVLAEYPREVRLIPTAPVRDAIVAAQTDMFLEWQERSEYASEQADPLYASGTYLDAQGEDRDVLRQSGESDSAYRDRIFATPHLVTPEAVLDTVNAILAPYTPIKAKYFERINDCWFATDGSLGFHSFVGVNPSYPDRFYEDDAALNGGLSLPNRNPGGNWVFGDMVGRYFVLRLPQLDSVSYQHAFLLAGNGSFLNDGTNVGSSESTGSCATFLYPNRLTSEDLYGLIVSSVNHVKGQSMRWMAIVDPNLE